MSDKNRDCDYAATSPASDAVADEPSGEDLATLLADDSVKSLVLLCLERDHSADEARRLMAEGAKTVLLDVLRGSLARHDFALAELHPNHPLRGVVTIDRARIRTLVDLIERLTGIP